MPQPLVVFRVPRTAPSRPLPCSVASPASRDKTGQADSDLSSLAGLLDSFTSPERYRLSAIAEHITCLHLQQSLHVAICWWTCMSVCLCIAWSAAICLGNWHSAWALLAWHTMPYESNEKTGGQGSEYQRTSTRCRFAGIPSYPGPVKSTKMQEKMLRHTSV